MAEWLKKAIFYEVYPQSFKDSNGDGIGDIPGLMEKLDYIRELGMNAIWINPCFDSPFYDAGYDVADYYRVAPRYGTNEDLKRLFEKAHSYGMHVLLDLVPGHTAVTHPWFLESMKAEKNEYTDRYVWTDSPYKRMENVRGIVSILRGISPRYGTCGVNCFSTQPALNYGFARIDDPAWQQPVDAPGPRASREELMNIMRFWLGLGCDGFRVDMAGSLVKNDDDKTETIRLWQEVRAFLDREFPEAVLVSEWGRPEVSLKAGFHMDFFLHFGDTGYMDLFRTEHPFFNEEGKGDISVFVKHYQENEKASGGKGMMCMPSGNHDMIRISKQLDTRQMKLAYAFIYALPGAPFLYYGDEIGMRYVEDLVSVEGGYERTGSRSPMQWDKSTNAGFSSAPAEALYIPLDPGDDRPDAASQMEETDSLYNTVKKLISVRQAHSALQGDGKIEFLYAGDHTYPLVFERSSAEENVLVIINPSGKEQECQVPCEGSWEVIYSCGGLPVMESGKVKAAAVSACWMKKTLI